MPESGKYIDTGAAATLKKHRFYPEEASPLSAIRRELTRPLPGALAIVREWRRSNITSDPGAR